MKTVEKKCPVCKKPVEGLVSSYGRVFALPCMHPVIRVQSPISQAMKTILLLKRFNALDYPNPNVEGTKQVICKSQKHSQ